MLSILEQVEGAVAKGCPADRELARIFRNNRRFGSRDRRFYSESVFSSLRWQGWAGMLRTTGPLAALTAILLDAESISPAIVALAEISEIDPDILLPLGELDLESKAEALVQMGLVSDVPHYESLAPDWAWDQIEFENEEQRGLWADSLQHPLPVWLRFARGREVAAKQVLVEEGIDLEQHDSLAQAWSVERNISRAIMGRKAAGGIEIQDLASQCVGLVCQPQRGQRWWDACAGGGGKTLHLADLMGNDGKVLATDSRSRSLRNLHKRLRRSNIEIVASEKMEVEATLPEVQPFDGVLLDAPCTGSGTWARNPDGRWRTDSVVVRKRVERQMNMLDNVSSLVKEGGVLVYSVCSVFEAECDGVVEAFLDQHPEFALSPFTDPLSGQTTEGTLLIKPWEHPTIGMYIARLERI